MKLVHIRALAFVAFGLVLILGLTRVGDPPVLMVDSAAGAGSQKTAVSADLRPDSRPGCAPVVRPCGKSCVRLMTKGAIA